LPTILRFWRKRNVGCDVIWVLVLILQVLTMVISTCT